LLIRQTHVARSVTTWSTPSEDTVVLKGCAGATGGTRPATSGDLRWMDYFNHQNRSMIPQTRSIRRN
jgi:hypothetical protein